MLSAAAGITLIQSGSPWASNIGSLATPVLAALIYGALIRRSRSETAAPAASLAGR
ncbi:hypothetical protein [Paeniglutamicibacter gangotriensis]|uniref:hypothetical protein n=1 Tax=Paeniglutamicibacter gangotriensis TaxID=254787 RepID=UPI00034D93D2|nr:hypothetical protein [Paeniglutamicibacter gangotriensis]